MYFSDKPEPQSGKFELDKLVEEFDIKAGKLVETFDINTIDDYYEVMDKCKEVNQGMSIKKVQKDTDRDYYMTAEQAKEYGLIDDIFYTRKTKK